MRNLFRFCSRQPRTYLMRNKFRTPVFGNVRIIGNRTFVLICRIIEQSVTPGLFFRHLLLLLSCRHPCSFFLVPSP